MQHSSSEKALAAERLARLRDLVRARRVMRLQEICRALAVSTATARRDLEELERRGELRRVHGGAVSVESRLEEPLFDDKTTLAAREKQHIAAAALARIKAGETIYLDGGSTVLALARLLRDRTNVTVVTNSLRAANELGGAGPRLILVGGELRRLSQTVVGPLTRSVLEELHVDRAFMGTMGFGAEGMTTTDAGEAFTKELVMRRAREVVLLADSSKAGKILFARAGRLEQVQLVITDKRLAPAWAKELTKRGIKVQKV
jgi:DeoR/GlpR family transcriptional regulator of sugar metabolism